MAQMIYAVMTDRNATASDKTERVPILAFRDRASAEAQAKRMGHYDMWNYVVEMPYIEELIDYGEGEHDGENH